MTIHTLSLNDLKSKLPIVDTIHTVKLVRHYNPPVPTVRFRTASFGYDQTNGSSNMSAGLVETLLGFDGHILDITQDGEMVAFNVGTDARRVRATALTARIAGQSGVGAGLSEDEACRYVKGLIREHEAQQRAQDRVDRRNMLEAAAQARDLIRQTYGHQANEVIESVLERLDSPGVPDTALDVAHFWQKVIRQVQDGTLPAPPPKATKTLFDLAREVVEARAAAFPDETVTLWKGDKFRVYVSRSQDEVLMTAVNGNPLQAARVRVGRLFLTAPFWRFTLSRADYDRWVEKARKL